jgi:anti-anti-sigma factor
MNCTFDTLLIAPADLPELVRGREKDFVERLEPVLRQQSVMLDFTQVERIDAAGISALISLYGAARDAGNGFAIANASARVSEILCLVGLDRILISRETVSCPQSEGCLVEPAA